MGNKAMIFQSKAFATRFIQNFTACKGRKNTECGTNGNLPLVGLFLMKRFYEE